ncbi:hypothetical protein HYQ46_000872 [Verticillium longisporum]|nr:hypothetical protein HYQ46_000872 [Verticillium longisporum]
MNSLAGVCAVVIAIVSVHGTPVVLSRASDAAIIDKLIVEPSAENITVTGRLVRRQAAIKVRVSSDGLISLIRGMGGAGASSSSYSSAYLSRPRLRLRAEPGGGDKSGSSSAGDGSCFEGIAVSDPRLIIDGLVYR